MNGQCKEKDRGKGKQVKGSLVHNKDMAEPIFRAFNPRVPMRIYRRHLPHWRQDGCTYFVTFRLADSLPRDLLLEWQEQDRRWLKARGVDWPVRQTAGPSPLDLLSEQDRQAFERRHVRRLHMELDQCHGNCPLRQPVVRSCVRDALCHFHGERWWVGDFVIMPNHIHGLWKPLPGHELETVLAATKGYISTRLTKLSVKKGKLWQQENYDRLVRDRRELSVWRRYIAENPQKARLREGQYLYHKCDWLD